MGLFKKKERQPNANFNKKVQWLKNSGHSIKGLFLEWLAEQELFAIVGGEIKRINKAKQKIKRNPQQKLTLKKKVSKMSKKVIDDWVRANFDGQSSDELKKEFLGEINTITSGIKSGNFYKKQDLFGMDDIDDFLAELDDEWDEDESDDYLEETSGESFSAWSEFGGNKSIDKFDDNNSEMIPKFRLESKATWISPTRYFSASFRKFTKDPHFKSDGLFVIYTDSTPNTDISINQKNIFDKLIDNLDSVVKYTLEAHEKREGKHGLSFQKIYSVYIEENGEVFINFYVKDKGRIYNDSVKYNIKVKGESMQTIKKEHLDKLKLSALAESSELAGPVPALSNKIIQLKQKVVDLVNFGESLDSTDIKGIYRFKTMKKDCLNDCKTLTATLNHSNPVLKNKYQGTLSDAIITVITADNELDSKNIDELGAEKIINDTKEEINEIKKIDNEVGNKVEATYADVVEEIREKEDDLVFNPAKVKLDNGALPVAEEDEDIDEEDLEAAGENKDVLTGHNIERKNNWYIIDLDKKSSKSQKRQIKVTNLEDGKVILQNKNKINKIIKEARNSKEAKKELNKAFDDLVYNMLDGIDKDKDIVMANELNYTIGKRTSYKKMLQNHLLNGDIEIQYVHGKKDITITIGFFRSDVYQGFIVEMPFSDLKTSGSESYSAFGEADEKKSGSSLGDIVKVAGAVGSVTALVTAAIAVPINLMRSKKNINVEKEFGSALHIKQPLIATDDVSKDTVASYSKFVETSTAIAIKQALESSVAKSDGGNIVARSKDVLNNKMTAINIKDRKGKNIANKDIEARILSSFSQSYNPYLEEVYKKFYSRNAESASLVFSIKNMVSAGEAGEFVNDNKHAPVSTIKVEIQYKDNTNMMLLDNKIQTKSSSLSVDVNGRRLPYDDIIKTFVEMNTKYFNNIKVTANERDTDKVLKNSVKMIKSAGSEKEKALLKSNAFADIVNKIENIKTPLFHLLISNEAYHEIKKHGIDLRNKSTYEKIMDRLPLISIAIADEESEIITYSEGQYMNYRSVNYKDLESEISKYEKELQSMIKYGMR